MMYESENEANKIDLLYEAPTKERNGVKVTVPVKFADSRDFVTRIKEQLAYFEGVFFQCDGISNDFKIKRASEYQWSELCTDQYVHICLDNVYYPLDFAKLGITSIQIPIGLRFSLSDGIYPIPNRESIKYTKEAKEVILDKIKKVSNILINKYNESVKDTENPNDVFDYYRTSARYIPHFNAKDFLDISQLKPYGTVKFITPKLKGITLLDMKRVYDVRDYMFQEYTRVYQYVYYNSRFKSFENNKYSRTLRWDNVTESNYVFSGVLTQTKKLYLKSEIIDNKNYSYFIKKDKQIRLGTLKLTGSGYDNYIKLLDLHLHDKKEWRQRIKEFQYVISLFTAHFKDLGDITIPKDWIESNKAQKTGSLVTTSGTAKVRRVKVTGEVSGKISQPLERYVDGKNCKFVPIVMQMATAHRNPYIVVYGNASCEEKFQKWYEIVGREKVKFMIFSERELKKLSEIKLHNWITMEEFEEGKHIVFKRAATSYLINKLINKYTHTFGKSSSTLSEISTSLHDDINILKQYKNKYHFGTSESLQEAIIELAESKNLFDPDVYDVYKRVKFILDRLPFFEAIFRHLSYHSSDNQITDALKDLCKYHKQRIDWQNYNLPLNEEVVEELTEEIVEQLV